MLRSPEAGLASKLIMGGSLLAEQGMPATRLFRSQRLKPNRTFQCVPTLSWCVTSCQRGSRAPLLRHRGVIAHDALAAHDLLEVVVELIGGVREG